MRNLDSLLEHNDFDRAEYSQKRHGHLNEIHALHRKIEETRNVLDELRRRKSDQAEFARFVSEADAFKAVTHKIMNLSFSGKQRLLRGLLDGPITVGHSTLIPHHEPETEDGIMKILDSCGMIVRYNQPLLLELLNKEHTTKSL